VVVGSDVECRYSTIRNADLVASEKICVASETYLAPPKIASEKSEADFGASGTFLRLPSTSLRLLTFSAAGNFVLSSPGSDAPFTSASPVKTSFQFGEA
jgi:hypothetical protein